MPPKQKAPAPIDRPLSRAYLREFSGWSTADPPGLSDPSSLRILSNVSVNRDGSIGPRPVLNYMADGAPIADQESLDIRGEFEPFYLNDGRVARLFATKLPGPVTIVVFRVLVDTGPFSWEIMTLEEAGFRNHEGYSPDWFASYISVEEDSLPTYIRFLQIDNKILALNDKGWPVRVFSVGADKYVAHPREISRPTFTDKMHVNHPMKEHIPNVGSNPFPGDPNWSFLVRSALTANTLIPNNDTIYRIGVFYTFSNELGETAPSGVTERTLARPWSSWSWTKPKPTAVLPAPTEPGGDETDDAAEMADQLLVWPGWDAFDHARTLGATHFNVYAMAWTTQGDMPSEALYVGSREITGPTMSQWDCWVRIGPMGLYVANRSKLAPSREDRRNYTKPSSASNGVVAADRLVLVGDPNAAAVVRWTSNEQGNYLNFTSEVGGGFKTLTSGNLQVPAAVALWQNPQSVDTLTILCEGTDGRSSSYYMAPAQIASQSEAVNIMGFEETSSTEGTWARYGVQVLNNALYHPTDQALIKSTAANYNINHKVMTEQIRNLWQKLNHKVIVAEQIGNRLYFLVHNTASDAEALEPKMRGNEVWVLDTQPDGGVWFRWRIQAVSLKKLAIQTGSGLYRTRLGVIRPEGFYNMDVESQGYHDTLGPGNAEPQTVDWEIETNTQGANRAHDAWAHLRQLVINIGNFHGTFVYGIRGYDIHGQYVEIEKVVHGKPVSDPWETLAYDTEDTLEIKRDMKEWRFFARAHHDEAGVPDVMRGTINFVQYRYTPISVNVGYAQGSVETFEYSRDALNAVRGSGQTWTWNGITDPLSPEPLM